jgi:hypothetical protein
VQPPLQPKLRNKSTGKASEAKLDSLPLRDLAGLGSESPQQHGPKGDAPLL